MALEAICKSAVSQQRKKILQLINPLRNVEQERERGEVAEINSTQGLI